MLCLRSVASGFVRCAIAMGAGAPLWGTRALTSADPPAATEKAADRRRGPAPVVGQAVKFGVSVPVREMPEALAPEFDPYADPRVIRNPALQRIRKPPI